MMFQNGINWNQWRRKQSVADVTQIQLAQTPGTVQGSEVNKVTAPIFPPIRGRRPLPALYISENETINSVVSNSSYFLDGHRLVDFVLVYIEPHDEYLVTASPEKEASLRRQFYLDQLRKLDLQLELHRHQETNGRVVVFVKIHVPWAVLCREAERLRMRLPLILEDDQAYQTNEKSDCWWRRFFWGEQGGGGGGGGANEGGEKYDDPPSFGGRTLTWTFDRQHMHLFRIDHPDTFFSWRHRTEIVYHVLQECRNDRKHDRRHGVETLLEKGLFDAAFPVHDGTFSSSNVSIYGPQSNMTTRQRLHVEWAGWKSAFKSQPLNRIRNYFGEKVGFYFAFMDFYTKMLIFPSAFGLLAFVYGLVSTETTHKDTVDRICNPTPGEVGSFLMCPICNPPNCAPVYLSHECQLSRWQFRLDNEATFLVACATLIWCAVFLKLWKRKEAQLALDWDTYERKEEASDHRPPVAIRPAYEERAAATKRSNPVTMEPESYVPRHKRMIRVMASISVATLLLIAAGGSLMGLIVSRIALYGAYRKLGEPFASSNVEWSRWTVHGFIFWMVVIFEWIYDNIADLLTELECPKTKEQFLSSLLWKLFIFEELVDFLPIAYAAWFRGKGVTPRDLTFHSEICEPNGCMSEVVELVAVLLLCRLVIGNIAEVGYPFFKTFIKTTFRKFLSWYSSKERMSEDSAARWPQWIKDYQLNELKLDGVAEEYMEMMIQFSFVAFFVPAFPLIPLLCLLNNVAEIRVDGVNFLGSHRRPVPERVPGLLIWNKFMGIILKVAVLCNAALIAFTSELVPRMYFAYAAHSGNTTQTSYKAFSMSKMLVTDWPELHTYLKEHPMSHGQPGNIHERKKRNEDEQSHVAAEIFLNNTDLPGHTDTSNITHQYCYYLDFRLDHAPYGYKPTWWKIFCLRVTVFTVFTVVFYILLFLCDFAIRDVPASVIERMKRREYLVRRRWRNRSQRGGEAVNRGQGQCYGTSTVMASTPLANGRNETGIQFPGTVSHL